MEKNEIASVEPVERVENAQEEVKQAAEQVTSSVTQDGLKRVHDVLGDILVELKSQRGVAKEVPQEAETGIEEMTVEPVVEVEKQKNVRILRRNGRKVKR